MSEELQSQIDRLVNEAHAKMKVEPLKLANEWISVEDRLPEAGTFAIASSIHGKIYATVFREGEFYPYGHTLDRCPIGVVSFWMRPEPLPEPPCSEK